MIGVCCDCGRTFQRDAEWKSRCIPCWLRTKREADSAAERVREEFEDELAANLPVLIRLCHPDLHGGSAAATRVTQWLLSLRKRLPQLERAA